MICDICQCKAPKGYARHRACNVAHRRHARRVHREQFELGTFIGLEVAKITKVVRDAARPSTATFHVEQSQEQSQ